MKSRSVMPVLPLMLSATMAAAASAAGDRMPAAAARLGPDGPVVEQMMRADLDKDGAVSREELERLDRALVPRFRAADADRDGKLTVREFDRLRDPGRGGTSGAGQRGATAGGRPGAPR